MITPLIKVCEIEKGLIPNIRYENGPKPTTDLFPNPF